NGETGRPNFTEEQQELFRKELTALVETHYNSPSIVMWVVFNEGWGQHDTLRYVDYVRSLDSTRWINCASGWTDKPCGDVHDIHVYPGPDVPKTEEKRAVVLGEFGGVKLSVDGHQWKGKTWGYIESSDSDVFLKDYQDLWAGTWELADNRGLSAAIYTQITDCEIECNGLLTYDRKIIKTDLEGMAKAARGELPVPVTTTILPDARTDAQEWTYTTEQPGDDWMKDDFDTSGWNTGKGSFGSTGTPGAKIGTEWKTSDIWIRRSFELTDEQLEQEISLCLVHDEDAQVFINGVAAAEVTGHTGAYKRLEISDAAKKALRAGTNTIAVHCSQTAGGQNIDAGVVGITWKPRQKQN
ncbi:MAG: glycoside hydrolase family 2 TIM barrel-domain containing protein, partial [Planctomycetia bacterium]|nr:glycoside hydrolase family 2 TIM barrel-domain containing protein [Planctomycetia bacterium]